MDTGKKAAFDKSVKPKTGAGRRSPEQDNWGKIMQSTGGRSHESAVKLNDSDDAGSEYPFFN